MLRAPSSFLTMSSSLSKYIKVGLTFLKNRYAEIVNVRLGDGSMRKGQVLEIAGKRAVV
jgi:hypothetical protein